MESTVFFLSLTFSMKYAVFKVRTGAQGIFKDQSVITFEKVVRRSIPPKHSPPPIKIKRKTKTPWPRRTPPRSKDFPKWFQKIKHGKTNLLTTTPKPDIKNFNLNQ
jgi:hypothetical protein